MTKTTLKTKLFSLIVALTMLVGILPLSEIIAYAVGDSYEAIALDEEKTVTLDGETVIEKIFAFTPVESGKYTFYSYDGDHDTYGYILDKNGSLLKENDDYGNTNQFCVHYEMTEGTTYLLKARFYSTENSGSMKVKVLKTPEVSSISFGVDVYTYAVGDVVDISDDYTVEPFVSDRNDLAWESSDESVAIVEGGSVLFLAPGATTITLSDGADISDSITFTVLAPKDMAADTEYTVDHSTLDTVTYKFVPEESGNYGFYAYDISGERVSLSVRNSDLGYVTDTGGHGEIGSHTYLYGGKTYYIALDCEIGAASYKTKVMKLVDATAMSLNYTTYDGYVDDDVQLEAKFLMGEMRESVSWTSSDETVAAVDDIGRVSFLAAGNATVTATSENGLTASCEITVTVHTHRAQGWEPSEDYHYGYCECGEYIEEQHEFNSNNVCVDCGYEYCEHEYTEYEYNQNYHYANCDVCGYYINSEHEYDASGKCVCGYFEHEHIFDAYDYDPSYHWISCSLCRLWSPDFEDEKHEYNAENVCECGRKRFTDGIYLGANLLRDGEYLDNDGNLSKSAHDGGYAYYKDGVLTLNNFRFINYDENPIYDASAIYSELDLELILIGINYLEAVGDDVIYLAMSDLAISGDGVAHLLSRIVPNGNGYSTGDGIDIDEGNLTVNGGTIYIDASSDGIEVDGDVEINGGLFNVNADNSGIETNGNITVNGGNFNIASEAGIAAEIAITINGGIFSFDCYYYAIFSYTEITFGEAFGELSILEGEYGAYWVDSNDNIITVGRLLPKNEERTVFEYDWIDNSLNLLVYNGEVQDPLGIIYDGDGAALALGVDYTVEYSGEVKDAGVYYAIVTGIGDYVGAYIVQFSVHEVYELAGDTALEFDAETIAADVYTMVKFTAPTSSEYTFVINMSGFANASVYDINLNNADYYESEDGVITVKLQLEAGETVYFDVYTDEDEPAPTEMTVKFVCEEHKMDGGNVIDEPTCTESGEITYTCQNGCGHTYTEVLDANGHSFVEITDNYTECAVCGEGICDHMCHKGGVYRYIWKIFKTIYDFLDVESECDCGEMH